MYAIVDVETTGGNYKTGRIIEFAVAIFDGKNIIDTYETLINPRCNLPSFITSLTGITDGMLQKAPYFEQVAARIIKILDNKILVAHNAGFDYSFIWKEFHCLGYDFNMHRICTLNESRKVFTQIKAHGLENLCKHLSIINHNRHRAMGDVIATVEVFKKILELKKD